ncbi:MAG: hypothetical protein HQL52_19080 [Magnetococcales bacterium]|nr:hypothetical protein [Magnetococcales bacterium]
MYFIQNIKDIAFSINKRGFPTTLKTIHAELVFDRRHGTQTQRRPADQRDVDPAIKKMLSVIKDPTVSFFTRRWEAWKSILPKAFLLISAAERDGPWSWRQMMASKK